MEGEENFNGKTLIAFTVGSSISLWKEKRISEHHNANLTVGSRWPSPWFNSFFFYFVLSIYLFLLLLFFFFLVSNFPIALKCILMTFLHLALGFYIHTKITLTESHCYVNITTGKLDPLQKKTTIN